MKHKILNLKLLVLLLISTSSIADRQFNFSVGYEKTSGDYGLENTTDITTVPLVAQYTKDAWRVRLYVPFISITGDGSVMPGSNGAVSNRSILNTIMGSGSGSTSTDTVVTTQSGLGDISISISYAFMPLNSEMFYELTAEAKWGTASVNKGLGTGENDYSVSFYSMYEKHNVKPFISLGYLLIGDTNLTDYNDVLFSRTGFMYSVNPQISFSVAYDYQQAMTDSTDEGQTLGLYAYRSFNKQWSGNAYVLAGLTDSVADSGIGFSFIHCFYNMALKRPDGPGRF